MKKSVKIVFLLIIVGLGASFYFYADLSNRYRFANTRWLETEIGQPKTIEQKISAPSPLRGPTQEALSSLTALGTIAETNLQRKQNGLPALLLNAELTKGAEMKVNDMFNRQYFEHESPTGEGPGELATAAGYAYLMVGENLALGNYKNDEALVEAWMNSPGHRENILNPKYTEIGVAVKRGTYEGQTVWLAVQEFGRPASLCPSPNTALKARIEENQSLLTKLEEQLSAKRQEIDSVRPRRGAEYNQKVDEYNELVSRYNALIEETKILISEYSGQVNTLNACIQS